MFNINMMTTDGTLLTNAKDVWDFLYRKGIEESDIYAIQETLNFLDYLENYLGKGKVTLEWFYDYNGSYPRLCNYLQPIAEKLDKEINEKIEELNTKLYRALQDEYEAYTSEDAIREELEENEDMLYYKSGKFYGYV